jgi:hypothetical protein
MKTYRYCKIKGAIHLITKPDTTEYTPYYASYIQLVPSGNLISILQDQIHETCNFLGGLPQEKENFRYAPDKWTLKEVVGHMVDNERIMGYRALRFSRRDSTPLAGYDENLYVQAANFGWQTMQSLLEEFRLIRQTTIYLFDRLSAEAWSYKGSANNSELTVKALGYIIAGHELHHCEIIKTRYL